MSLKTRPHNGRSSLLSSEDGNELKAPVSAVRIHTFAAYVHYATGKKL